MLIDRLPSWLRFKRDVRETGQIARSFPLDLVDGIDPSIGFRLSELDIGDVQNLATANPVELFVETPYSFGQIIDWMAQAQLLAEIGPQRFVQARASGIRDIMTLICLGSTSTGRVLLKPILSAADESDDALEARVTGIGEKLHVRHLRHWSNLLLHAIHAPVASPPVVETSNVAVLKATS